MNQRTRFLASVAAAMLITGCGGPDSGGEPVDGAVDTLALAVIDTIGLEIGDSCYVFGQLLGAGHAPDGRVFALDMQGRRLSVFSPDGGFLGHVGTPGPGPGEFQVPIDFALLPEGKVAVTDAISRVISFFDAQGNYTGMLDGFFPTPPMRISGSPDGAIIGQHMPMVMTGGTMEMSLQLSRWTDSPEPDLTYLSRVMQLDLDGDHAMSARRGPEFEFAVGPDGSVFVAEISDTLFLVTGYASDGEEFLRISEPMERVAMTEEEIEAGGLGLAIMVSDEGASANMSRVENTYPWRNIIASIGVDSSSRIWVEMACYDRPLFRVYDAAGGLLFVAVPDQAFPQVGRPAFRVDAGGILAFDRDPVDWPKIYLLRLLDV